MEVQWFEDARRFRDRVDPLLLANEAANNLILGVTTGVIENPDRFEGFNGWVVVSDGEPLAAAAQTVPFNLILAVTPSDDALGVLAAEIGELPGVVGCRPGVDTFVAARPERHSLNMSQGVFQLTHVDHPIAVDGISRPARLDEAERLAELWLAFEEEALGGVDDPERTREITRRRIEEQSPRYGAWVHEVEGRLVSASGHSGPTPNGIRIGPVYTPPDLRGRGYASSLVAAESQWLLDHGYRYCFLYTDLANPTSNSIYKRIGYRQIAESAEYAFNP